MPNLILIENLEGITIVTFNRPAQRNALSAELREQFVAALAEFNADASQRALVITGAGGQAFSAGQDLKEARDITAETAAEWQEQLKTYLGTIRNLDKPCIAAVNGAAIGAGFYTALLCDIRIAHPAIRMGQPELNVGFPSIIGTRLMYMTLGHSATVELTLSGRLVDGDEALRRELVNELVTPETVLPRAIEWARDLAAKPPQAMKLTKQALREFTQDIFDGAIETGKRLQPIAYGSGEPQQVIAQFMARKH